VISPIALAAGGGVLVVTCGASLVLVWQDTRRRRLASRLAECVAPLAPALGPTKSSARKTAMLRQMEKLRTRAGGLLGFDLERRDAYPIRILFLLLLAVVPAILALRLLDRILALPLDMLLPFAWLLSSRLIFGKLHARHADRLYRQFPDVLSMIVRSVRVGIPLHEALRTVARESPAPTAAQFQRVADEMAIGIRLDEALRTLAARSGVPEYGFFSVTLSLQLQTGGSLAEALEGLADVIRKRVALRQRAIALASEARTSAMILAALPVVTGIALAMVNYEYIRPLFETVRGERVLYTAIGMLLFAGVVMRTMIQRSLR
jgi:tight adherence protein B